MAFHPKAARHTNSAFAPLSVVSGDDVTINITSCLQIQRSNSSDIAVELGHGLVQQMDRIVCLNSGVLQYRTPAHFYIDDKYRTIYFPKLHDKIIGVIEDRGGDVYKVNIFSGSPAILPRLAFQGATKRNRPDLKKGDMIYCQVSSVDPDLDVELTCISSSGVKKDWASGEAIFGGLVDGILLNTTISYSNTLLRPDSVVLNILGQHLCFEVAIGMNGGIWLKAASPIEMIIIRNALLNSEGLDNIAATACIEVLLSRLGKKMGT